MTASRTYRNYFEICWIMDIHYKKKQVKCIRALHSEQGLEDTIQHDATGLKRLPSGMAWRGRNVPPHTHVLTSARCD
eukprot:24339-Amphidinium_carterae.1